MILRFHEDLRDYFPESIELEAATPLDALKLIAVQHPLNGKIKPIPVKIKQLRTYLEVNDPTIVSSDAVFDIVPTGTVPRLIGYSGAGGDNGGLINIIIGIVIIAVAVITQQYYLATTGAKALTGAALFAYNAAINIGVGLTISGVMQILAPTPKEQKKDGNLSSRTFGVKSTSEIGTPIQIVFGTCKVGFHLFSFNVESRNYSGVDDPTDSAYFNGKVDDNLPVYNINKFYGFIQAGDKVRLNQIDNNVNRTGTEF